jgi:plasmid stability protein
MAALTVRNLDDVVYEGLKEQARSNQRSVEAEVRTILAQNIRPSREQVLKEAEAIRRSLVGRYTGDPTAEIREDRDSR